MSRKFYNFKTYNIGNLSIECKSQDTSYGFRHICSIDKEWQNVANAKACYYNRTWESYEYESVINKAIDRLDYTPETKKTIREDIKKIAHGEVEKEFSFIGAFAKLGEVLTDNQEEANNFKKRILNAGLNKKGLVFPENWNSLSEDEKTKRLNGVIEVTGEKIS